MAKLKKLMHLVFLHPERFKMILAQKPLNEYSLITNAFNNYNEALRRKINQVLGMSFAFTTIFLLTLGLSPAKAMTAAEIDADVQKALTDLYAQSATAKGFGAIAKGILVFPDVYKAGFLIGGSFGDGALLKNGTTAGYYRTLEASYGLQAGVQSFGYVLFFMQDAALAYLDKSEGWEIGVGPSLVVVDKGFAGSLTTTTAKEDIYAFFFDQKGLMAGLGLKGSKITRIHPD